MLRGFRAPYTQAADLQFLPIDPDPQDVSACRMPKVRRVR